MYTNFTVFASNDLYTAEYSYNDSVYYNTSFGAGVFSQLNKMKVVSENYRQKFIVYYHRLLNLKKIITLVYM
jgi:hypothetical protein